MYTHVILRKRTHGRKHIYIYIYTHTNIRPLHPSVHALLLASSRGTQPSLNQEFRAYGVWFFKSRVD